MAVYLIHFDRRHRHAGHYLGFADGDVEKRLEKHRTGRGARLLAILALEGIGWRLVRVWEKGDRTFERRLKNRKESPRLCPVCNPARALRMAARCVILPA